MRYRNTKKVGPAALALAFCALAVFFLTPAQPAFAAEPPAKLWKSCESGSDAGQCSFPVGIASDPATGHLYVADSSNSRINELTAWGEFVKAWGWGVGDGSSPELQTCTTETGCFEGLAGGAAGQLSKPLGVATDSEGNVYVVERDNHRVQKFNREGDFLLMFGGDVNKTKVEEGGTEAQRNLCTAASGNVCQAGTSGTGNGQFGAWAFGSFIAIGPDDTVYVGDQNRIQKFSVEGAYQGEIAFPGETVAALAVDPQTGQLYVNLHDQLNVRKIGVGGEAVCTIEGIAGIGVRAIAADPAGRLYVVSAVSAGNRVQAFNPDCSADSEVAPFGEEELSNSSNIATGSACLTSGADVYLSNAAGGGTFVSAYGPPPDKVGLCPPPPNPPDIEEEFATSVKTTEALLKAQINPRFWADTSYYLEYGTQPCSEGGCTQKPLPPGSSLGAGAIGAGVGVGVHIDGLSPATTYHYRFVATSHCVASEPEEECTTIGADRAFLTFPSSGPAPVCPNEASRIGPGAFLPDCRAYEMVSPLDKGGSDIRLLTNSFEELAVLEQSSTSGDKLAYGSVRSFGGAASSPFTSQYIARRITGEEWRTHPINPPRGTPVVLAVLQLETEFKAFSADLCDAWLITNAEPPLAPGGLEGHRNLYRRTDELCSEDGKAHYETLAPIAEPKGIPAGTDFFMKLLGVSADGRHAVFKTDGKLTTQGAGKGTEQLYESVRGTAPRLACILPGEAPESGPCTAGSGTPGADPNGSISSDGERIFWSAGSGEGEGKIYARSGGTQTVAVSKAAEEEAGTSGSWFWGSADDGSKAIFSTGNPSLDEATLYSFEPEGEVTTSIAEGLRGVMGMSADADRIYFASSRVLSGEEANSNGDKAQAGKANLYLYEAGEGGGSTRFIATLAGADEVAAVSRQRHGLRSSRVSPDGAHATFASFAPLTGYDNKGAKSGVPTQEIYRYDATTDALRCVSCNPSGARPAGPSSIPFLASDMHGARVLSADGSRLYFESADALTPRDSNGRVDVYQWEEPGAGSCDEADAGFSAAAGGCVELVSSGQSPQDSRFVEASPTGDDVFFATVASLLPQDFGVFDIYDARVGGGLPIPPPSPPPCEGDACHAQVPAPEEPTPASSDYVGPPTSPAKRKHSKGRCAKGKRRATKKGKSRCVAAKHKRRRAAR